MENLLAELRHTTPSRHLIVPRLVAGVPLVVIGAGHYVDQAGFVNMLESAGIPLAHLNALVAPGVEVVAGLLLLSGALARLGGVMAASTMVVALYAHLVIDPSSGVVLPPIVLPLAVLASALYVAWRGAGAWSLDRRATGGADSAGHRAGVAAA